MLVGRCVLRKWHWISGNSNMFHLYSTSPQEKIGSSQPLIQKIFLRFKGLPLPGETEAPKSMFDDIGKKVYHDPLPTVPKDFKEFPERDIVNFPYPEMLMYPEKTRFSIIPDKWLKEIEKVTGTSGPYLAIFTFAAYCVNKELFMFDANGQMLIAGFIPTYLLLKHTLGYRATLATYGWWKEDIQKKKDFIQNELMEANDFRKFSKEQTESFTAVNDNFPTILRENLALQLEATYRNNVERAWNELKRRLDYLQDVQETKERFAREVQLKTITEGVRKQVELNEGNIREKYMDQCIENLKLLAK